MSWVSIWIHLVFCTKNRQRFLDKTIRRKLFEHIKANAKEKGIWLDSVNGYAEHAHCLVSLGREQTIAKVTQLIKGETSMSLITLPISERHVPAVRNYIFRQEEHHQRKSFAEEVDKFMKKYGWSYVKG